MPCSRGRLPRQFARATIVRLGHVGKADVALLHRADERIPEHEVDVIADQHQVARLPQAVDSAGGVGDDQRRRAERVQHPRRECGEPNVVAFVHVKAAGERENELPRQRSRR